jgi:hypothetical protein
MHILIYLIFLLLPCTCYAQKNNVLQSLYLSFDDDFFNYRGEGTDREYTAGLKLKFYYTKKNKPKFLDRLLMELSGTSDNLYGWGITQLMYAPNIISNPAIIYGDRPYAGLLFFNHSLVSSDVVKKQKITTEVDFGVIGKYSLAGGAQTLAHKLIHYQIPKGWDNQIATDFILNYFIQFEKLLVQPSTNLEIIGVMESNFGTWKNTFGLGFIFRGGKFNSYFSNYENAGFRTHAGIISLNNRKFQFYFFMRPVFRAVMDDATLQGGFFTHNSSPYTLTKDQITNSHLEFDYGFVISKNKIGFSFNEQLKTKEFNTGVNQQYGNLTLMIGL